ncbi:MAG TPA: winged helix DNA-binding domain-containing protein [Thermoleophilaceae bacterium]|nr:winged helix DNA-binding domain-containing protein [Thermoleophilaceae bacterium]
MPQDPLAIVQRRLHAQRLASGHFEQPAEAVQWLGAMQAQEYAEAKWSIGERVDGCTDAEVEEAFARGDILRTHVLRPTWHFVTPADIRWMLQLTAPRVHAANRYSYRKYELPSETLERSHDIIAAALEGGEPLTRPELAEALAQAGIVADGLRLGYILMHAELEALICSGPRRGKQHTYARFESRVPESPELAREEALAELALRFFRSRRPATIRDFSAWSGLTMADAKAGREMVADRLDSDADDGRAAPGAFLIPMYDELGISYKDLRMVLARQPPREGMLSRPIVIDGLTVGSWKRTVTRRAAVIEAALFTDLSGAEAAALDAVVERFGRFMELPASVIKVSVEHGPRG